MMPFQSSMIGVLLCAAVFSAASCAPPPQNIAACSFDDPPAVARVETVSAVEQVADAPAVPQGNAEERVAAVGRMAMEKKASHRAALRDRKSVV